MARDKTAEPFTFLLQAFSKNEAEAVSSYTELYDALVRFFRLRGDFAPEEAADLTIDRLSEKIKQSEEIRDLKKYGFGVARLVFLERLRRKDKEKDAANAFYQKNGHQFEFDKSDPLENFRTCFESLSDADKALLKSYFADKPFSELSRHREEMCREMGVSPNRLRMTVYRLREKLEQCVKKKNDKN
ncbi:MAG: sigma-70 family RNA polymerase sigma factor [Pyrinomonadaceae bacterium]|nr:sigma-70 family RNA polymerase sigma factor [Pyrinomonadaceae bacterium]